jgi:hypothetical protein
MTRAQREALALLRLPPSQQSQPSFFGFKRGDVSMRRVRLNGWQRIGILLSVVWAIGGTIWVVISESESDTSYAIYDSCVSKPNADPRACDQAFATEQAREVRRGLVFVFAPIPIAWLVAYALVALVRWIRVRFKPTAYSP